MPLGIQRLNAKKSQPNDRIMFIKPLKGPDEKVSKDFLEKIAAQCSPIMKTHYLSVTTLEEYEPNREFVGRNFNAGEVIQLVLKTRSGHWLPFNYVQMVMMHELAHCKQMNHSKAFWAVRNKYAEEMRELWTKKYTGKGIWGRGALLGTGQWENGDGNLGGEELPEHLCGGTYKSRGMKRKRKVASSYKEMKERRILKKFGAGGVALGEDVEEKRKLEGGKKVVGKPRVAGSLRGRELRAAAALARFETQKKEEEEEEEEETDSGEDYEDEEDEGGKDALDIDGKRMLDGKGRGMVKVEDESGEDDLDAKQELRELLGFGTGKGDVKKKAVEHKTTEKTLPEEKKQITISKPKPKPPSIPSTKDDELVYVSSKPVAASSKPVTKPSTKSNNSSEFVYKQTTAVPIACPICSFTNEDLSATCGMCANVLDPRRVPGSWACTSQTCKGSQYRNAGDNGVCGVCGERRR
ncbi:WLM domain-protein [Podospora fimiseda]|uniref:WLM domain-protein n=1 Tax=Podospora fimiseda TaxID=252190 RepID=A0AAN7H6Z7_9PEZI|nr:WLM domain-protein [Podospora fimiseda]